LANNGRQETRSWPELAEIQEVVQLGIKPIKNHKTVFGNLLNQDGNTDAQPALQRTLITHWLQTSLDILAKIHLLASLNLSWLTSVTPIKGMYS